jgi:NADH:ubiquinone oxidoreductase subunit E
MQEALPEPNRDDVLVQLQAEQEKSGYVSEAFMEQLAQAAGLSLSEVYAVATFYHFLAIEPQGRYIIRVCKSLACYLKNSRPILEAVQAKLGLAPGETTPDGKFSLHYTSCIGACDQAPAMLLNHDLHGNLTPEKIGLLLDACP